MNEADLRVSFENRKSALAALGGWVTEVVVTELKKQLGSKVAVEKFLQIPPKPRVKETDSFLEKALVRKPKADPLLEITDQVGVRFVVLLLEDIDFIGSIIQSDRWLWQKDRDHEEERLAKPDYFAYQSDHYVIRTKASFEFNGVIIPAQTPCEIQVRTILQHAYAEMAHNSDYKPTIRLPEEDQKHVKRSLAKGSALIETTDDVFKEIKNRLREYNESVDALLIRSSEIYKDITGEATSPSTALGGLVADTYRGLLKKLTPEQLKTWVDERPWLGNKLVQKRAESVFYRDSVVILLGLLVTENEMTVPKQWPVDSSYLEDFYTMLGISTNGLF
ncbi:MAG: GTP pyrophosphokinase [Acidithiobacillus sp.]